MSAVIESRVGAGIAVSGQPSVAADGADGASVLSWQDVTKLPHSATMKLLERAVQAGRCSQDEVDDHDGPASRMKLRSLAYRTQVGKQTIPVRKTIAKKPPSAKRILNKPAAAPSLDLEAFVRSEVKRVVAPVIVQLVFQEIDKRFEELGRNNKCERGCCDWI